MGYIFSSSFWLNFMKELTRLYHPFLTSSSLLKLSPNWLLPPYQGHEKPPSYQIQTLLYPVHPLPPGSTWPHHPPLISEIPQALTAVLQPLPTSLLCGVLCLPFEAVAPRALSKALLTPHPVPGQPPTSTILSTVMTTALHTFLTPRPVSPAAGLLNTFPVITHRHFKLIMPKRDSFPQSHSSSWVPLLTEEYHPGTFPLISG